MYANLARALQCCKSTAALTRTSAARACKPLTAQSDEGYLERGEATVDEWRSRSGNGREDSERALLIGRWQFGLGINRRRRLAWGWRDVV